MNGQQQIIALEYTAVDAIGRGRVLRYILKAITLTCCFVSYVQLCNIF